MTARISDRFGDSSLRLVVARVSRVTDAAVFADFGDELEEPIAWPASLPAAVEGNRAVVAFGVVSDRSEPPPAIAVL